MIDIRPDANSSQRSAEAWHNMFILCNQWTHQHCSSHTYTTQHMLFLWYMDLLPLLAVLTYKYMLKHTRCLGDIRNQINEIPGALYPSDLWSDKNRWDKELWPVNCLFWPFNKKHLLVGYIDMLDSNTAKNDFLKSFVSFWYCFPVNISKVLDREFTWMSCSGQTGFTFSQKCYLMLWDWTKIYCLISGYNTLLHLWCSLWKSVFTTE